MAHGPGYKKRKRPDFKKWAKKWFSPGSKQIPPTPFHGIGEKKPLICDVCGNQVDRLKGEEIDGKMLNRCGECRNKGIFTKWREK